MSCVLRVFGKDLEIDALLGSLSLEPITAWKVGEQRSLRRRVHPTSGANFNISNADSDEFALQLSDAESYLALNAEQLLKIVSFSGIEGATMDFAVSTRKGFFTQTNSFSALFLQQIALLGLGLAISHYPTSDDADDSED